MKLIFKAEEKEKVAREEQAKRESARKAWFKHQEELNKPKEFYIPGGAWASFLDVLNNGEITRIYQSDIPGGAWFIHEQVKAANIFLKLVIRDRGALENLIVDEFEWSPNNIPLSLPDADTEAVLKKEAGKLGLDYETYLRAIFHTRVTELEQDMRQREERRQADAWDNRSEKITGYLKADLRKKLEAKYGQAVYDNWFAPGRKIFTHFDMLIKAAEEYLGKRE